MYRDVSALFGSEVFLFFDDNVTLDYPGGSQILTFKSILRHEEHLSLRSVFSSTAWPFLNPPLLLLAHVISGQTVTVLNGPVLAVDKDVGANAVVKYRLLGDKMNFFTVAPETGNAAPPEASRRQFTAVMQVVFVFLPSRCDSRPSGCRTGPRGLPRSSR